MMAFYRSVMSSKGQLVIPADLRRELRLRPGMGVTIEREGDRLIMVPDSSLDWRSMRGWLKGKPSVLNMLEEDRKRERRKVAEKE
jgi:AbrB family looped-hinge helix DNA binding protein